MAINPATRSVRTRKGSVKAFRPATNYGQTMSMLWNTSKIDASLRNGGAARDFIAVHAECDCPPADCTTHDGLVCYCRRDDGSQPNHDADQMIRVHYESCRPAVTHYYPGPRVAHAHKTHRSVIGEDASISVSVHAAISHEMPARRIMRANLAMAAARRYADRTGCTLAQAVSILSARRNANGSPRYSF